jgi:hypothetical protein
MVGQIGRSSIEVGEKCEKAVDHDDDGERGISCQSSQHSTAFVFMAMSTYGCVDPERGI